MSADALAWGELLRSRRTDLGWSLADLAGRTGISRAYISALERGRSKRPGAETIRKLEDVVGPLINHESRAASIEPPQGLAELAAERGLSPSDVKALSTLSVRGRAPRSKERWAFIYQALLSSESMDDDATSYQAGHVRQAPGDSSEV
jgi:transcriptional regulator with XRE-family HTH domain